MSGGTAGIAGSGTTLVTLTGTLAQINSTLASNVTYVPTNNFNGDAQLTMTTHDNGNTGPGGDKADLDFVAILVGAPVANDDLNRNETSPRARASWSRSRPCLPLDTDNGTLSVTAVGAPQSGGVAELERPQRELHPHRCQRKLYLHGHG